VSGPRRVVLLFAAFAALPLALLARPDHARAQTELAEPRPSEAEVLELRRRAEAAPKDAAAWAAYGVALVRRETLDDRLRARPALERAVALAPKNVDYRLALADLYFRQQYTTMARQQLKAALANDKDSSPAYARLGRIALRDWVKFQRRGSLDLARSYWQDAARRDMRSVEPWLGLGLIALIDQDAEGAVVCGREVIERGKGASNLSRGEAWLLQGAGWYGLGRADRADSAFANALPLLAGPIRNCLTDITPAASDADTAAYAAITESGARARFLERFWRARDPDITTPYNEVQLEMLSRGTLAYFLFYDAKRRDWDERARYWVRYGPPQFVEYNPILATGTYGSLSTSGPNRLVWHYPKLGLQIYFEDRYLNNFYDVPMSTSQEVDYFPHPDRLLAAERAGDVTTAGRGLFRPRLPHSAQLRGDAVVARFRRVAGFDPRVSAARGSAAESGAEARVEAYVSVAAGDTAWLRGQAVVLEDSTFREVARQRSGLFAWCGSDSIQVMQFNFDLPRGSYVIGMSVRDTSTHASGTWKRRVFIPATAPGRIELSDLELACGFEDHRRDLPFSKSEYAVMPNPVARVARDSPFGFYFEIYNLVTGSDGRAQVATEYTIRSTKKDKRPFFVRWVAGSRREPAIEVSRVDDVPGRARFQYVTANLEGQAPGPYRIEVVVRDPSTGLSAAKSLDFELTD
jgi:GWxTD domain-containing protein